MAVKNDSNLVLRTVYIEKSVDDSLRRHAFERQISKNNIIREGVDMVLKKYETDSKKEELKKAKAMAASAEARNDNEKT